MAIFLFFMVALFFGVWISAYIVQSGPQTESDTAVVTILEGSSVEQIGHILARAGIIHEDFRFRLLAKFSGYANSLQAGEFRMYSGQKPLKVLKNLTTLRSVQYAVTIPEGLNFKQIGAIFAENGWCDVRSFENLIYDRRIIQKSGLGDLQSLEGYLFPDTYLLEKKSATAETIILMMVKRFVEIWHELVSAQEAAVINQRKAVILASIVEKETADGSERPLIAGVFLNRLHRGMRLQSDPTVMYGIEGFTGALTRRDLRTPTPYNTYTLSGLPIGPICNPGRAALQAVIDPLQTKALYFVAKNDGTHQFSNTLKEHNRAVRKFQRKKPGKKGK